MARGCPFGISMSSASPIHLELQTWDKTKRPGAVRFLTLKDLLDRREGGRNFGLLISYFVEFSPPVPSSIPTKPPR